MHLGLIQEKTLPFSWSKNLFSFPRDKKGLWSVGGAYIYVAQNINSCLEVTNGSQFFAACVDEFCIGSREGFWKWLLGSNDVPFEII